LPYTPIAWSIVVDRLIHGFVLCSASSADEEYRRRFELASDLLLNSSFPTEEIERLRHDRLTQILQQKDNPNILGQKFFLM